MLSDYTAVSRWFALAFVAARLLLGCSLWLLGRS